REGLRDAALRELGREAARAEEPALHAVVPSGHALQDLLHALLFRDRAARHQGEGAERQALSQKKPPLHTGDGRRAELVEARAHDSLHADLRTRPVNMLGSVRGTSATMTTCTITMNTTPAIAKKCSSRAPS